MKKCSNCKEEKSLTEFSYKNKNLNKLHSHCKACCRIMIRDHYIRNKGYYLKKTKIRNNTLRLKVNSYIRDYLLNHRCVDCGESDIAVLEFDHTRKESKLMAVSSMVRRQCPLNSVTSEIGKCEVRCANCHRRKTAGDFGWFKTNAPVAQRIEHQTSNL